MCLRSACSFAIGLMQACIHCLCCPITMTAKRVRRTSNMDDAFMSVYNNITKCEKLQKLTDLEMKDSTGWSLIHRAVLNEDNDMVRSLCGLGMNTGIISNDMTPLQLAIERGNLDAICILLECGCSQQLLDNGCYASFPPLLMAMMSKLDCKYDMIKLLISCGSDVNKPDRFEGQIKLDTLPLCFAVRKRDYKLADILLNSGAKILVTNGTECVSLFIDAILLSCKDIVELFIRHGADVNMPQKSSRTIHRWRLSEMTPLQASILAQDINVMQALLAHNADPNVGLKQRALHNFIPCHAPICMTAVKTGLSQQLRILLEANCALTWSPQAHRTASTEPHTSPLAFVKRNDRGLQLLLTCGCRPLSAQEKESFQQSVDIRMLDGSDFSQWLKNFWCNPQSLLEITRNALRKTLGVGIAHKLATLGLPKKVEDYLLIKDLLDDENG